MKKRSQANRPQTRRDKECDQSFAGSVLSGKPAQLAGGGLGQEDPQRQDLARCDTEFARMEATFAQSPENLDARRAYAPMLHRKGIALKCEGRFSEALPFLERHAELAPASGKAHRELGYCLAKTGQLQGAIRHYTRAINLEPTQASHYNDLGLAFLDLQMLAEAKGAFQEVLRLNPGSAAAYLHLSLIANLTGLTGMAVRFALKALEINPSLAEAHNNVALVLRDQGELGLSLRHYRQALALKPERTDIFSGYLLALNYDATISPNEIAAEHLRADRVFRVPRRKLGSRSADPTRKLRVGYLSPDLHYHSVAYFIAPVIEAHHRDVVEVTCYHTGNLKDYMTERIRVASGQWRDVYRASDEELAAQIEEDGIDILVELSGHTADNRLTMLAGRAAPLQASYLGYPNTTGLSAIDLRITDAIADPPGQTEGLHSEKLIRVKGGFLAYSSPSYAKDMEVGQLPARKVGYITFGSFNNLSKIQDDVVDCWATILAQMPGSRLLLKARGLRDERVKQRISVALATRGIVSEERITLLGHELSAVDHMRTYQQVDIALDPFPYNGTTTTCEALWMGVPVVTLEGRSHVGRVGASILCHAGLGEWVAPDRQAYIDRAVSMAGRLDELAAFRKGIREKLLVSPLMDGKRVACQLEELFRQAWLERQELRKAS